MNYTIFMPQTLTGSFHAIVDTVSCIIHYGFDILSEVFCHYSGIIGLKSQFFSKPITNNVFILIDF